MSRLPGVALLLGAALLIAIASPGARADDAPPTPAPAPTPPPPPPDAPTSATDDAEMGKILEELQAEEQQAPAPAITNQPAGLPDLSKVNLVGGLPGIARLNPNLAVILEAAGAAFGTARPSKAGAPLPDLPLQTGGHDATHNGFTLRQVELALGASVDPYLRFDASLVFKDGVEVEEAYATTLALPLSLQARAGEFLSHFGRHNEQHPHAWWFVSQPLVYGQLLGEDNHRGLGAELSWLSPLPWATTLFVSVQESAGACCSRTFSPEEGTPAEVRSPLDLIATGVVEQFFPITDDLSLLWGLSAQAGPAQYLDPEGRGELWATDVLLRYRPAEASSRWFVELQAEGMLRTRHRGGSDLVRDAIVDGGTYAQLIYHPNPELGAGVRYDLVDGDAADLAGAGLGHNSQRGGLLVEYAPTHFSRLQAELNAGTRGQNDLLWGAMLNLEVAIGAHGAHAY